MKVKKKKRNLAKWLLLSFYFTLFHKLRCLPLPDEYLIGVCCFICMLYNLGLYNHSSGREAAEPVLLSPTLSVLPEVPLDILRREQEKDWVLSYSFFCFVFLFVHADAKFCRWTYATSCNLPVKLTSVRMFWQMGVMRASTDIKSCHQHPNWFLQFNVKSTILIIV